MEKIKQFVESERGKDILIVAIVVLVGASSFGLGRLSKGQTPGIKIEYPNNGFEQVGSQEASAVLSAQTGSSETYLQPMTNISQAIPNSSGKTFFASNKGSKYYPVGCSAGKSLKLENRIYFATREEAERAGYELSSSCR